uniref:Uncharacterized protein n=1 Tax=Terrapene triunguis TaxID=2587831 RepID=A0A674IB79_9SAUR
MKHHINTSPSMATVAEQLPRSGAARVKMRSIVPEVIMARHDDLYGFPDHQQSSDELRQPGESQPQRDASYQYGLC